MTATPHDADETPRASLARLTEVPALDRNAGSMVARLPVIDALGWTDPVAVEQLDDIHSTLIRPVVIGIGLRGQLAATGGGHRMGRRLVRIGQAIPTHSRRARPPEASRGGVHGDVQVAENVISRGLRRQVALRAGGVMRRWTLRRRPRPRPPTHGAPALGRHRDRARSACHDEVRVNEPSRLVNIVTTY